jgi:WD40 repeat protein
VASGRQVHAFEGLADGVLACALSADGAALVSGSRDRTLRLWDAASGRQVCVFEGHAGPVWACALSADDGTLVSGSQDNTLRLWDVASGKGLVSVTLPWIPDAITFSRARPNLFFTGNRNGTVAVFDFSSFLNRQRAR